MVTDRWCFEVVKNDYLNVLRINYKLFYILEGKLLLNFYSLILRNKNNIKQCKFTEKCLAKISVFRKAHRFR